MNGQLDSLPVNPHRSLLLFLAAFASLAGSLTAGINSWTSTGPYGGPVGGVVVSPSVPSIVYAASYSGVFRSVDAAVTWSLASRGLEGESISVLRVQPSDPQIVYAGTIHGVFKTNDGGANWLPANAGIQAFWVRTLAIDPQSPATIYAGFRDYPGFGTGGILKSTDGGTTWSNASNGLPNLSVDALQIDSTDSTILYAGNSDGVFRTVDSANTWSPVILGLTNDDVIDLEIDANDPQKLYCLTAGGLFRSANRGDQWDATAGALPSYTRDLLWTSSALYAAGDLSVARSTDEAATWSPINSGLPAALQAASIVAPPGNSPVLYLGTRWGLFKTQDATNWTFASEGITAIPVNALAVHPSSPMAYAGTSLGVFRSLDTGRSWSLSSAGLHPSEEVIAFAIHPTVPATLYAGTFLCCGLNRSQDSGATWTRLASIPGYAIAIDPSAPSTLYIASAFGGGIYKSTDGGVTASPSSSGIPSSLFTTDVAIDSQSPATLYAAAQMSKFGPPGGVFKTTDGASSWVSKSVGLPATGANRLALDPLSTQTVFAATQAGLFRSDNGAEDWVSIQNGLPPIIGTFTNIVAAIAFDPVQSSTVYVGTNGSGVFRSTNRGDTWQPFSTGLTDLNVLSLAISRNGKVLHAGTSRGSFRYQIPTGHFHTLAPCRLIDTRDPIGPNGGPAILAGGVRLANVLGRCGIPPPAIAIAINVTVTAATGPGSVTIQSGSSPLSGAPAVHYRSDQTRANNAIVPLDDLGAVSIRAQQASGSVHVILDVSGYFE